MAKFILRRLLNTTFVVLGLSTLVFFVLRVIPGDPAALLLPPTAPKEAVDALRLSLGLDQPLYIQYVRFLQGILHGDLGNSYRLKLPATALIAQNLPPTFQLAITSLLVAIIIAVPLGILAASRRGSALDVFIQNLALLCQSTPIFWLGLVFIQVFAVKLRVLPAISGTKLRGLVMPAMMTLPVALLPVLLKTTRSEYVKASQEDFIRTAQALGLPRWRILVYTLRAVLVPLITLIGMQFGYLLGGAMIVEYVFARPGIGSLAIGAVAARDFPLVQAVVIFTSGVFLIINLITDITYSFLDPRIRYQEASA